MSEGGMEGSKEEGRESSRMITLSILMMKSYVSVEPT